MKHNRMIRAFSGMLLALLLLMGSSVFACAERGIDLDREGSLQLRCMYDGKPVAGGDLRLYRVADVEQKDGDYYFHLLERFGGNKLVQKDLDSPGLAGRLASSSGLRDLEYRSAVFDANGKASFSAVKPGLYLLGQSRAAKGFQGMAPFLVSVPLYDKVKDSYLYDVDISVKPALEREVKPTPSPTPSPTPPPGPKLPQTGQLNWPVPLLAGLGLACVLTGGMLLRSDRRRKRG